MITLPKTKHPLILRTDYSSEATWKKICEMIPEPVDGFLAYAEFHEDRAYQDINKDDLMKRVPEDYSHWFIIVGDQITISSPEYPILVIDLLHNSGCDFRSVPSQIQGIENNLSIANMDFWEFSCAVDEDGIFRGF